MKIKACFYTSEVDLFELDALSLHV